MDYLARIAHRWRIRRFPSGVVWLRRGIRWWRSADTNFVAGVAGKCGAHMTASELAQIITSIATLIGVIVSAVVSLRNGIKIDAVHKSTNGLAQRNEAIARKLGVEEGKATEKANPT